MYITNTSTLVRYKPKELQINKKSWAFLKCQEERHELVFL